MYEELKKWREERGLENTVGNIELNIYEELMELMGLAAGDIEYEKKQFSKYFKYEPRECDNDDKVDALCDMIVFAVNAIEALGYNAEKSMNETIKEISSRKGEYNPNTKKWEKFKTDEAKALWYKADYSKCKR